MHVISVKLTDEEYEELQEQARKRGLYPHGVARIGIRREIGLPIPKDLLRAKVAA